MKPFIFHHFAICCGISAESDSFCFSTYFQRVPVPCDLYKHPHDPRSLHKTWWILHLKIFWFRFSASAGVKKRIYVPILHAPLITFARFTAGCSRSSSSQTGPLLLCVMPYDKPSLLNLHPFSSLSLSTCSLLKGNFAHVHPPHRKRFMGCLHTHHTNFTADHHTRSEFRIGCWKMK